MKVPKFTGKGYTFKEDNSIKVVFLPSEKKFSALIEKEFAHFVSKFLPFRKELLLEAGWCTRK